MTPEWKDAFHFAVTEADRRGIVLAVASSPGWSWLVIRPGHSLPGTTNHPAPAETTGLEVDKFDTPAVNRYIMHYLDMVRDAAGPGLVGAHGVAAKTRKAMIYNAFAVSSQTRRARSESC